MELFGVWGPAIMLLLLLVLVGGFVANGAIVAGAHWKSSRLATVGIFLAYIGLFPWLTLSIIRELDQIAVTRALLVDIALPSIVGGIFAFATWAVNARPLVTLFAGICPVAIWTLGFSTAQSVVLDKLHYATSMASVTVDDLAPDGSAVRFEIPRAYFREVPDRTGRQPNTRYGLWLNAAFPSMRPWQVALRDETATEIELLIKIRLHNSAAYARGSVTNAEDWRKLQTSIRADQLTPYPAPNGLIGYEMSRGWNRTYFLLKDSPAQDFFYFDCFTRSCIRMPVTDGAVVYSYTFDIGQIEHWRDIEAKVANLVASVRR